MSLAPGSHIPEGLDLVATRRPPFPGWADTAAYMAYIAVGAQQFAPREIRYTDVLSPELAARMPEVGRCLADFSHYLETLPPPQGITNPDWARNLTLLRFAKLSEPTGRRSAGPILLLQGGKDLSVGAWASPVAEHFGSGAAARIAAEYPLSAYPSPSPLWALGAALTDAAFACPAYRSDGTLAAAVPTYAYEFDDPRPAGIGGFSRAPGAVHGSELAYVFQRTVGARTLPSFTAAQRALSDRMADYWTRFAATGDPRAPHAPAWPAFTARTPSVLGLAPTGIAPGASFAARHKCAFWLPLLRTGKVVVRL